MQVTAVRCWERCPDEQSINFLGCLLLFLLPPTRTIALRYILGLLCSSLYTLSLKYILQLQLLLVYCDDFQTCSNSSFTEILIPNMNCLFAKATQWDPRWHSLSHHFSSDSSTSPFLSIPRRWGVMFLNIPAARFPEDLFFAEMSPNSQPIRFHCHIHSQYSHLY